MKAVLLGLLVVLGTTKNIFLEQDPIIERVNNLHTTWKAGHNHYFDGKTIEEIKQLMGSLETPEDMKLPEKDITPSNSLPENFDSREEWADCESIKEIRDQSTCGSCWAFGAVEAMSDRLCIASGQKDQTRISSEDLLTCCGLSCGFGCNGGHPSAAWTHFKRVGVVTGDLHGDTTYCRAYTFPPCDHHVNGTYGPCGASQPTPKCVKQCSAESGRTYHDDIWHVSEAYSVPSHEEKIMTEISKNGPIEVSFTVYEDFLTYKSGVYKHTSGKALGGHAVKAIGWGVENGVKYWTVVNSWNEGWGDHGTFKILRGHNECGIEAQGVAGHVKVSKKFETQ